MAMSKTPEKRENTSINSTLTPVRFLNSPRVNSPAYDSNLAVCKTRLDQLIKQLQDNYSKWQLAQTRGLALCKAIEALKTRCLERPKKNINYEETLYPNELDNYCSKLAVITSIFFDITTNTRELLRQLHALNKLPNCRTEIFSRTWQLHHFVTFTKTLLERYEKESSLKQWIMTELPHCMSRKSLIGCTTAWEFPQYVDSFVNLQFLLLAEEIKTSSLYF